MGDPESTTVHLFQGQQGEGDDPAEPLWYWHAKGGNGEIVVASAHGEPSEEDARLQLEDLVDVLWDNVEPDYVEDSAGEWRWSLTTQEVLRGRSSEGFVDRSGAKANFELGKTMLTRRLDVVVRESADG